MSDPPGPTRRDALLDAAIAATATCVGVMAAWPAARSLSPAAVPPEGRGVVGARRDFAPGTAVTRALGALPVLVTASPDGVLRAFDARCTHLGCAVGFDPASREIACACHGGRFALDGRVLAGPPPAPLRALRVEVVGDDVFVEAP
ncbi:MAG: Rieske (2Fe-2S) protein [Polyangiales bacterium]